MKLAKFLKKIVILILLGITLQFIASFIVDVVLGFFPKYASDYADRVSYVSSLTPRIILIVGIISPIVEELLFRGALLYLLKKITPFMIANIIQAILFGLYHGNVVQGIYAFVIGMFLGYIAYKCGGIVYTITLHMSVNFMGLFLGDVIPQNADIKIKTIIFVVSLGIFLSLIKRLKKYFR